MTRYILLPLILALALPTGLRAQDEEFSRTEPATLTGTAVAEDTGEPVPSVRVEVLFASDSTSVAEGLTNAEGRFTINDLFEGEFFVRLTHLGYGTVTTRIFEVADGERRDLGPLTLPVEAVRIDAIEVSAERNAVTYEADRTSYNLGVMPMTEGGSATDAMRAIPELEVNIDGEVSMRGSAPAIYINGRPAPMSGEALAIFLEQFPADFFQKIEIIDNPSARYDAEGSGGIINLVLKEGVELGLSGSVFANAGTRGQYGAGARGTLQRGDWTFNGGSFLRLSDRERESFDLRQNLVADPAFLRQDSWSDRSGLYGSLHLDVRYEMSDRMRVWTEGRLRRSGNASEGLTTTTHMNDLEEPFLRYDRSSASDSRDLSGDIGAGFEYVWEPRVHELEVEVELESETEAQDSREEIMEETEFHAPAIIPAELTLEHEDEWQRELALEVDYTRPLGEDVRLEIGYDAELENSDNDRLLRLIEDPVDAPDGERLDRGFDHRQIFNTGYVTLRRDFGDLGVQVGVRAEHVNSRFEIPTGEVFRNTYTNLFPSGNVSYRLDDSRQVRLSYSRRIRRPSASVLNPMDRSTDPLNRRVGNPAVEPQFTHSVSLNANWSGSKGNVRLSPYYRKTTNGWTQITTVDDEGVSTRTYQNLASESSYGASLTYSLRPFEGWNGHVSLSGRRNVRDASNLTDRYSGSSFRWFTRASISARVSGSLSAEGNFSYSPPNDLPQGREDARYSGDFGIRYEFLDDRASARLSLRDPFGLRESSVRREDLSYIQIGRSEESTRSAELSVSYSLGGGGSDGGRRGRGRRR